MDDFRGWYDYYSPICNHGLSREIYSFLTNDELELELELWYIWFIIYFNKIETKYMNAQQSFLKAASMFITTWHKASSIATNDNIVFCELAVCDVFSLHNASFAFLTSDEQCDNVFTSNISVFVKRCCLPACRCSTRKFNPMID